MFDFDQGSTVKDSRKPGLECPSLPIINDVVPKQRKVGVSRGANIRGMHPVLDGHSSVAFESQLECDWISNLVYAQGFKYIETQPFTVYYTLGEKRYRYTPDIYVEFYEPPQGLEWLGVRHRTVIECKPACKIPELREKLARDFQAIQLVTGEVPLLLTDEDLKFVTQEKINVH